MSTLETVGLILGIIGGGSALLYPLLKKLNTMFRTWTRFMTDWEGEDAAPGRDAVPGVMARLNKLDGELTHNGGKSVKDVVVRLEKRQDKLEKKMEEAEIARHQNHIVVLEAIKSLSPKNTQK
jgi:predicted transcriptional regulator